MGFLSRFKRVPIIRSPTAGLLDLMGPEGPAYVQEDRALLASIFGGVANSVDEPPECDVLFVYCRISPEGVVEGSRRGLREVIRDSKAKVVVVASANTGDAYVRAGPRRPFGAANLVMTLDRCGGSFAPFFGALFLRMKEGVSMPVAWTELAPQGGSDSEGEAPSCIFSCEVGQLAFG